MPPTDENQNPNATFSPHPVNWSVPPQQARAHRAVGPNPNYYRHHILQQDRWTCLDEQRSTVSPHDARVPCADTPIDDPPPYLAHSSSSEMGLDVLTAHLGYKYDNERHHDPDHSLNSAAEWRNVSRQNPPENVAAISKKRKSGGADSDETDLCMAELTEKYRTLGAHLWCECKAITRMSKTNIKLFGCKNGSAHGRATLEHPPENIVFQDYFMHKRQRRSNKSMTAQPSMSAVNVYVNTRPGQSSQSHQVGTTSQNSVTITSPPKSGRGTLTDSSRQNLPDEAGTKTTPIEIVESPSPSSGYPLVADIFCHMDNLPDFRNLEIPPSTFATYLEHEWEHTTVKQAAIVH
ncbi:hypothetical protein C8J56DRAFT_891577 [Mycena floridula]|nr:hypothetical protein C8J56DRAFT_891577 [Mycena floridula]